MEVLQLSEAVGLVKTSVVAPLVVLLVVGCFELGLAAQTDLGLEVERGQEFLVVTMVAWRSCQEYHSN